MRPTTPLVAAAFSVALLSGCASLSETTEDAVETTQEFASESWTSIQENWGEFRDAASERWADLTEDDLDDIDGEREELVDKVQEYYGVSEEEAERQVDAWAVSTS